MKSIPEIPNNGQVNFDDMINDLIKNFIEKLLKGELTEFLNYDKYDSAGKNSGNSRNGSYSRNFQTKYGVIENLIEKMYGQKYSATSVSNPTDVAAKEIEQWKTRPLEKRYSVLFIDALSIKIRREHVGNESAYIIIGINEEGYNSKWSEQRLKGFLAAIDKLIQLFEERY